MRRYGKQIKDKHIYLGSDFKYIAYIEYYQDVPERDKDETIEHVFNTFSAAQRFLRKFPRDVWDGFDVSSFNYKEIDERKRNDDSAKE